MLAILSASHAWMSKWDVSYSACRAGPEFIPRAPTVRFSDSWLASAARPSGPQYVPSRDKNGPKHVGKERPLNEQHTTSREAFTGRCLANQESLRAGAQSVSGRALREERREGTNE